MSETQKARRGDLVVVHTLHRYYVIGQGQQSHDEFTVGVVTNITRDGAVKAYRPAGFSEPLPLAYLGRALQQMYLVPQSRIDVPAALKAAEAHTWPGNDYPRYYDTLDEVKDALRPHLIGQAVKS